MIVTISTGVSTNNVAVSPNGNTTDIIIDSSVKLIAENLTFLFSQLTPAKTWTIAHNLGKYPSISVVDSGGNVVYGEYKYIDLNNVTATFSGLFSGSAYLN